MIMPCTLSASCFWKEKRSLRIQSTLCAGWREAVKKENPNAEYLLGKALLQGVDFPQDTSSCGFFFWKERCHGTIPMRICFGKSAAGKEYSSRRIFQEPWSCLLSLLIKDSRQHSICWARSFPLENCSRRTSPRPSSI